MNDYKLLAKYYQECFSLIDTFHFNSEVTQSEFHKWIIPHKEVVIPITHSGISDNRRMKNIDGRLIRIAFIGPKTAFKGLPTLIQALRILHKDGVVNWCLYVWGNDTGNDDTLPIVYRGKYNNEMLTNVYAEMDLLVVPSIWKETFSLVTLEALSYGVPVLVSDNVGAKLLVYSYDKRFVYHGSDGLMQALLLILSNPSVLQFFNQRILTLPWHHSIENHAKEIIEKLY